MKRNRRHHSSEFSTVTTRHASKTTNIKARLYYLLNIETETVYDPIHTNQSLCNSLHHDPGKNTAERAYSFTYRSPFGFRFCWMFFPLGFFSLPTQYTPPGPVTLTHSRPLEDFLNVNSTSSPSIRLRNPSMCSLLWDSKKGQSKRVQLQKDEQNMLYLLMKYINIWLVKDNTNTI